MKRWSIILLRGKTGRLLKIDITEGMKNSFFILLAIFFSAFLYLATQTYKNRRLLKDVVYTSVKRQVYLYRISYMEASLKKYQWTMQSIKAKDYPLRVASRLPQIDKDVWEAGIGGPPPVPVFLESHLNTKINNVKVSVSRVSNEEKIIRSSISQEKKKLREKINLLDHTPSIYPVYGRCSSPFGWRIHPITHKPEFHKGYDIANLSGTPIRATADGIVSFAGIRHGFGNTVEIKHGYGFKTRYAHLRKYIVRRGQPVKKGNIIGYLGSTGFSTGPHLHYEVRVLNQAVNPYNYLDLDSHSY